MAVTLPYLASYKNVPVLFDKIASAKVPDRFTHNFLTTTIGLKGTNDRSLISLLRHMGFLDQSAAPTASYSALKGPERKKALAAGIKKAYAPLFDADQAAHSLTGDRLKGLIAQVAGVDSDAAARISGTFGALVKQADFEASSPFVTKETPIESGPPLVLPDSVEQNQTTKTRSLRPEFHYNLQIHLPSNGSEETYINIFNAIRKTFQ